MKILTVPLIREADVYTIANEPIADIDLMERAAGACADWLQEHITTDQVMSVFCGPGNNGGDGLAIARMMMDAGYQVLVYLLANPERMTGSCKINYDRLRKMRPRPDIMELIRPSDLPELTGNDVVVDAIFGNGLARAADGMPAAAIHHINAAESMVIAVDVPSGLFCDTTTLTTPAPEVIRADYTLTFSPPKLALFFPENDQFLGEWQLLDIGISQDFIDSAGVNNFMLDEFDVAPLLKPRLKFSHKGNFGHALLIAGSTGKMGAAVLSARACLRSGAGLVTVRVPASGVTVLQTAVPEAMLSIDPGADQFSETPDVTAYSSIGIGPGTGTSEKSATALKILIQQAKVPLVIDADAINILAENRTWLAFLPAGSVFTPHPKEFGRLAGNTSNDFERNRMQREFCITHRCYMILKGAHTAITTPDGSCYFNTTGNPGMATGGSGDVLTGILTGLMAQGYSSLGACLLGVYLHGLAGDMALKEQGFEALTAGDIITNLGKSFQSLYGKF